jgi:divalent metal cation (Fe/Co/Zn/Cd) transporter
VAATFFLLGAYVFYESATKLIFVEISESSLPGIVIVVLSLIIMPVLSFRKHNLGMKINSKALVADSNETMAYAFLLVPLLLGLTTDYFLGFW